ncbi:MAG TPA: hypothetical protein VGJ02_10520 [Pyrinomonadaceae bacterium]
MLIKLSCHSIVCMRTTLNIDEDILEIAKEIAVVNKVSLGRVISELAKEGMEIERAEKVRAKLSLIDRDIDPTSR